MLCSVEFNTVGKDNETVGVVDAPTHLISNYKKLFVVNDKMLVRPSIKGLLD
jgi:hypothetical protein